jgi:hypothetical protein
MTFGTTYVVLLFMSTTMNIAQLNWFVLQIHDSRLLNDIV